MPGLYGGVKAKATVIVCLEVALPDVWTADATVQQVFKQAKESARNIVLQKVVAIPNIIIKGEPVVTGIFTKE